MGRSLIARRIPEYRLKLLLPNNEQGNLFPSKLLVAVACEAAKPCMTPVQR